MSAPSAPSSFSAVPPARFVTIYEMCAMTLTYRKLYTVCRVGPVWMVTAPLLIKVVWYALRRSSGGNAVATVLLTLLLSLSGFSLIKILSRTKDSRHQALVYNQVRLPLWSFVISCAFSRYALGPALTWLGWKSAATTVTLSTLLSRRGMDALLLSVLVYLRCAVTLVLLGLVVTLRYMTHVSVMRCSSVPLATNPIYASIRRLFKDPFSIAQPGDSPGELLKSPFSRMAQGRRYRYPTFSVILSHCTLSIIIGLAVAYTVFPCLPLALQYQSSDYIKSTMLLASALTVLGSFLFAILALDSHEIDPTSLLEATMVDALASALPRILRRSLFLTIFVPIVAMVAGYRITTTYELNKEASLKASVAFFLELAFLYCGPVSLYLLLIDESIRASLFNPVIDLEKIVSENCDDRTPVSRMDVILHCLLLESDIVLDAWKLPERASKKLVIQPNAAMEEELQRSETMCEKVSKAILSVPKTPEVMIEADILRVAVLESLGGQRTLMKALESKRTHRPFLESVGSSYAVQEWLDYRFSCTRGREPLSVPLLRALCGFIGGSGKAILQCAQSTSSAGWVLPHGLLTCAEYAVVAMTRCIVQSMTPDGLPSWNSTHVSTQIPSCLTAVFLLRIGLIQFEGLSSSAVSTSPDSPSKIQAMRLVRICDNAAAEMLLCMSLPPDPRPIDLPLKADCFEWIAELLSRIN